MLSTYSSYDHAQAFSEFLAYKTRVPVRGAILLNEKMNEVLLVKGWKKGANWSFPRGKINKDEPDLDCAIREVYEETGYDIKGAGLVTSGEDTKYIEMNLREQHMRLYVFRGVPSDTHFEPRTRKEISKIDWWKLSDLPTLKKKKNQQDNHGGDLAVNANKFYMVAPFLPQLKKWISAQRKLDKTRQTSISAPVPVIIGEELGTDLDHDVEEEAVPPTINGDIHKLLESLRQSAQPEKKTDLAKDDIPTDSGKDMAAQLKSFLGVPANPSNGCERVEASQASEPVINSKADGILAFLQSKVAQSEQVPETPMEQVIDRPTLPSSPPHIHHQPQRFSSMPPPPIFPSQDSLLTAEAENAQLPQAPQVRTNPPPQHPAQLVPRLRSNKPPPRAHFNQQARAPYQRTGDPQFAHYAQLPSNNPPSIPPASKLPPPKLTAQSSALLDLFKHGPSENAAVIKSDTRSRSNIVYKDVEKNSTMDRPQISQDVIDSPSRDKERQASRPTNMFVPPQVLPRIQLGPTTDAPKPTVSQHDKLLNLFRTSSSTAPESAKPEMPQLQLPSTPIELSALPVTPGHSREASAVNEPLKQQGSQSAQNGPAKLDRDPRQTPASLQSPPVSATINGPLNIPQFEMVAKASKEAKHATHKERSPQRQKRSPITILARPASSHGQSAAPVQPNPAPVPKQQKYPAPKIHTLVTPVKKPPPTPDLKGHEAPPKAFQPQILRRPAHLDDFNEPSPIQPLPSPKHNFFTNSHPTQPADQKKSLLSLFTKPSPAVSPPSAPAPASAIDPSALISPLAGPTPKEQAEAAFARLSESVGKLSHEPDVAVAGAPGISSSSTSHQLPLLRTGAINNAQTEGSKTARSGEKLTPIATTTTTTTSKTTPVDKAFLLGFLHSVAEGGK